MMQELILHDYFARWQETGITTRISTIFSDMTLSESCEDCGPRYAEICKKLITNTAEFGEEIRLVCKKKHEETATVE